MKIQQIANLMDFASEVKLCDIHQAMIIAKVDEPPGEIPIMYFFVQVTAGKSGMDYIIVYRENIGKSIYHEEENLKELHKKALEAVSIIKKILRTRNLEVLEGEWSFNNKGN